ncbi:MFS transporter [Dongia sp.]|jgi:MFS family permease|uniref:MFS transporter n=1 Tax=Dongia sp. TaxID=1977262 RepID=UPI0035AE0881
MISNVLAAALARRQIHYGWAVAGTTFLTMLVTAGAMGGPAVLLVRLQDEFGWTNSDISTALSVRVALYGLMGPFTAALMNKFGVRRMILTSLAFIVIGLTASLAMTQLWQLTLLWGVVLGLGTGMTAIVLGATVATRWFTQRRGLVIGLLTASSATGQLVFIPLFNHIAETTGWRWSIGLLCVALAAVALIVAAIMRNRPSDIGLLPYGDDGSSVAGAIAAQNAAASTSIAFAALHALKSASRSWVFWVLAFTFFICGTSTNGLIQPHLVPFCLDFGVPTQTSANLLAMMGIFDFIGTVASGWLSDRFDNRWLLFWYYGLRGLSLLYLPASDFTFVGLSIFAVFYGLDWIATVPPTVKLCAERFGRERATLIFGWVFAAHQLGAAAATKGAGWSRTELDTYLPAFFTAGALCIVASILVITVKKQAKPAQIAVAE